MEIVKITTSGDANQKGSLADIGGKGLFAKEIDQALLDKEIDFAVHSLKDIETVLPDHICLAARLPRDDPRDALMGYSLDTLPKRARIATCSVRRAAQMQRLRPDVEIVPMRGNIETRLAKLRAGVAEATLLSYAGLQRLGMESEASEVLATHRMIPAVGQGVIVVCARDDDGNLLEKLSTINCLRTALATETERAVLRALDGSCHTPVGVYAQFVGDILQVSAILLAHDGDRHFQHQAQEPVTTMPEARDFGYRIAEVFLTKARDLLREVREG